MGEAACLIRSFWSLYNVCRQMLRQFAVESFVVVEAIDLYILFLLGQDLPAAHKQIVLT